MIGSDPTRRVAVLAQAVAVLVALVAVAAPAAHGAAVGNVGTAAGGPDWPTLGEDPVRSSYSADAPAPAKTPTLHWELDGVGFDTSPVVADGTVYAGAHNGTFYAVNTTTGDVAWTKDGSFTTETGRAASVTGGVVFAADGSSLVAMDASSGATEWTFDTGAPIESAPAVVDGTVYVGSNDDRVYAIDGADGSKVWEYTTGGSVKSGPAVADGRVYVGSSDNAVYALDAATGAKHWSTPTGGDVVSTPTVADGTVYVGSDDQTLYALDASSGVEQWHYDRASGLFTSSVAVADGTVYAGRYAGGSSLAAIDASDGSRVWNVSIGSVKGTPAVVNGSVYAYAEHRNSGYLHGFDAQTGETQWRYGTEEEQAAESSPAVVEGVVYVGANDTYHSSDPGGLYALTTPPTARIDAPASVASGGTVTLDASGSTPRAAPIDTYDWDLDDDGTYERTGEMVESTFDAIGGQSVTLRVTDERGVTDTRAVWIGVANPDRGPLADEWPAPGHGPGRTGTASATGIVGDVTERWYRGLDGIVDGPPVLANDTLYTPGGPQSRHDVAALNASTGATVWTDAITGETTVNGLTTSGGVVYVGASDGTVHALDARTGHSEWTQSLDASVDTSPAVAGETVVVGTASQPNVLTVYGLDPETGAKQWQFAVDADTGLAVANDTVYVGTYPDGTRATDTRVFALNATTGDETWRYTTRGQVPAVAVRGETVYVTNDKGDVVALDRQTGTERWNRTLTGLTATDLLRPAVTQDAVYVSSGEADVASLDRSTGERRWTRSITDNVYAPPTVVNGSVYLGISEAVYALDPADGATQWTHQVTGVTTQSPLVAGDRLYLGVLREEVVESGPRFGLYALEGSADTGPTAALDAATTSVQTGDAISFDAANATDDSGVARIHWEFGDGATATGETVSHAFDSAGDYDVTVTVTDTAGYRASESVTVSVSNPGTGGGGGGLGGSVGPSSGEPDAGPAGTAQTVVPIRDAAADRSGTTVVVDDTDVVESVTFQSAELDGEVRITSPDEPSTTVVDGVTTALADADAQTEPGDLAQVVRAVDITPTSSEAASTPATVRLRVSRDAVPNPESAVVVHETNQGYEVLDTSVAAQTDTHTTLSAQVDSFSTFAVAVLDSDTTADEVTDAPATERREAPSQSTQTPAQTSGADGSGFGVAAALCALALACWLRRRDRCTDC